MSGTSPAKNFDFYVTYDERGPENKRMCIYIHDKKRGLMIGYYPKLITNLMSIPENRKIIVNHIDIIDGGSLKSILTNMRKEDMVMNDNFSITIKSDAVSKLINLPGFDTMMNDGGNRRAMFLDLRDLQTYFMNKVLDAMERKQRQRKKTEKPPQVAVSAEGGSSKKTRKTQG